MKMLEIRREGESERRKAVNFDTITLNRTEGMSKGSYQHSV